MVRRFVLTYQREGYSVEIEGVLFSNLEVAIDYYPDDEWPMPRGFLSLQSMEHKLNEFGETSIKWIDEEETESNLHYSSGGSYLAPNEAIDALTHGLALVSPMKAVTHEQ